MKRVKDIEKVIEGFKLIRQHLYTQSCDVSGLSISHSQWLALMIIGRSDSVTIGYLCKTLGVSSSAATQLANNLEDKGYILRKPLPSDARVSMLVFSPATKKKFNALRVKKLNEFTKMFDVFTDEEFETYVTLHMKLTKFLAK